MEVVKSKSVGRIVAGGMLREGTPLEYYEDYRLFVKREDKACPPPGPPFSKARGVYAWCAKQDADLIGVLDTRHSQGGHAVARACQILGKQCLVFYPEFKHEPGWREPQEQAQALGAELIGLPAGRSAILYHAARKETEVRGGVMIANALKLVESVEETAKEVALLPHKDFDAILLPISSGTIAAGVIRGFEGQGHFLVHLGYSRSEQEVRKYLAEKSGYGEAEIEIIDECYAYKDEARPGETPPWLCNPYYDLKTFRWYLANQERFAGQRVLLWNIG